MSIQIKQTEDKELLNDILQQLHDNDNYCPCALIKNPSTKCMCQEFRDVINKNEPGKYECHCGRYILEITED